MAALLATAAAVAGIAGACLLASALASVPRNWKRGRAVRYGNVIVIEEEET